MNIAVILSAGRGIRLGSSVPKQYLMVNKTPVFMYSVMELDHSEKIDSIIIVAEKEYHSFIYEWIEKKKITKFKAFAEAGSSRQHSILNGMFTAFQIGAKDADNILFHDAARPNISTDLIDACLDNISEVDGVMPALPVKDTVYVSSDGKTIQTLLNRDSLYAGQTPEAYILGKYYSIQKDMSNEELSEIRGSSEIAFQKGLIIRIIPGDEHNYKITTVTDLHKFESETEK